MPARDVKTICSVISNWQCFGTRAGSSLKCGRRRTALSPPQKVSGNHGMLLQASAPGHGGSYSLSKSLEWKRNVTGYFKANGFFHWIEHLSENSQRHFFSLHQISAYVNVYVIIRTALTASSLNSERLFWKGETDRARKCARVFLYLPTKCKHNL